MIIHVQGCWAGKRRYFRLSAKTRRKGDGWDCFEIIHGSTWNRFLAKEALDLIEKNYGIPRESVRFQIS
jgi:hypothetical protein